MSEDKLWRDIKRGAGHIGHFSRVESHATSVGFPDVDFCIDGKDGKIELKYAMEKIKLGFVRQSQVTWMKNRLAAGAKNIWIISHMVYRNDDYYLVHDAKTFIEKEVYRSRAIIEWITSSDQMFMNPTKKRKLWEPLLRSLVS